MFTATFLLLDSRVFSYHHCWSGYCRFIFNLLAALTYIYDGYLIGADDSKYLALSMGVVFILYLPSILLVRLLPAGVISLVGIWAIYGLVFIGGRALSLWLRIRTDAWM